MPNLEMMTFSLYRSLVVRTSVCISVRLSVCLPTPQSPRSIQLQMVTSNEDFTSTPDNFHSHEKNSVISCTQSSSQSSSSLEHVRHDHGSDSVHQLLKIV